MKRTIYGVCGEIIEVSDTKVSSADTKEHSDVLIELDGLIKSKEGDMCIILSPKCAKDLAGALNNIAEEAYEKNYQRIIEPHI